MQVSNSFNLKRLDVLNQSKEIERRNDGYHDSINIKESFGCTLFSGSKSSLNDEINNKNIDNKTQIKKKIESLDSISSMSSFHNQYIKNFKNDFSSAGTQINFKDKVYKKLMVSSNYVQLIPQSIYKSSSSVVKQSSTFKFQDFLSENVSEDNFEKKMINTNKCFDLKEYTVDKLETNTDIIYSNDIILEKNLNPEVCMLKNDVCELDQKLSPLYHINKYDNCIDTRDFEDNASVNIEVPNIPLSLCVSCIRQEKLFNKKLHAIWLGYKTRCILKGSLKALVKDKLVNESIIKLNLNYNIHEILISILDLYDLIKDEEAKGINSNFSWIQVLYEQTYEFKKKYIKEINRLLENGRNSWISFISKANNKENNTLIRKLMRELPSKFEKNYKDKILNYKHQKKSNRCCKVIREQNIGTFNNISFEENFKNIHIPFNIANSKSLVEISNYLNISIEKLSNLMEGNGYAVDKNLCGTPELREYIGTYFTPKSTTLGFCENQLDELNSDVFYTPKHERHVEDSSQIKCKVKNSNIASSEFYPVLDKIQISVGDKLIDYNRNFDDNDLDIYRRPNTKPKPYLKRKSKSIVPSKETDVELKNVTSRVKEIYRNKSSDRIGNTKLLNINEISTKIPGASSNLKLISGSPSRNSSSKVSRIPKYCSSRASISPELNPNAIPLTQKKV